MNVPPPPPAPPAVSTPVSSGFDSGSEVAGASGNAGVSATVKNMKPEKLSKIMRTFNLLNSALLVAASITSLFLVKTCKSHRGCDSPSMGLLSTYLLIFSLLLFVFEARVPKASGWLFKYFGFVFSNRTKAAYLLFLATLALSVTDTGLSNSLWILSLIAGIVTAVNGIFIFVATCWNPSLNDYTKAHIAEFSERMNRREAAAAARQSSIQPNAAHTHSQSGFHGASDYSFGDVNHGGAAYGDSAYSINQSSTPFAENPFSTQQQNNNFASV